MAPELPFDPERAPDPDFQIPDLTEAVEGWRAWAVPADPPPFGVAPKLLSPAWGDYYWTPRQIIEAECDRCSRENGEGVPGENCHCGFYSAKSYEHLMSMSYHTYNADVSGMFHVVGQVANWGKVIEATLGWRAQFSYPVKLFIPFEAWKLAKPLMKAYGIPLEFKNILKPAGQRKF